eukprot:gene17144-25535_t
MPPSTPPPPPPPPPLPTEYEEDPYTFLDDDQASAEEHTPAGRIFIPTTTAAPADTAAEGGVGDNERVFNTVPECETSVLYGFKAPAEAKRGKSRNYIATVYLADALNEHSLLSLSESCAFYCNAKSINPDPLSPACLSFSIHEPFAECRLFSHLKDWKTVSDANVAWTTYSRSETCSDGSAMVQRTDDALAATTTTTRTSSTEVGEGKMQLQGCALHGCNGAFTSDTSCSCDSSCTLFDDCCSDYAHVCLGETTTTAAPTTTTTTTTTTTSELEEAAGGDIVPEGCTAVN